MFFFRSIVQVPETTPSTRNVARTCRFGLLTKRPRCSSAMTLDRSSCARTRL